MATFFQRLFSVFFYLLKNIKLLFLVIILLIAIAVIIMKTWQSWDDDPDRGAIPLQNGAFGESYSTPTYLDQGWSEDDSLWYYNTTQGSALLPYDFFLSLEQATSNELFRDNKNTDRFRYLPQKPTFFNPDGLAVGFVKETYQGKDYVGYTCAACHTNQVNYKDQAIRIDGGPAMADMNGFLVALEKALYVTLEDTDKKQRFIERVIQKENDFENEEDVTAKLEEWARTTRLYNTVNHSKVKYGYARLDAFGRIYNRVLQHMINKPQLKDAMRLAISPTGNRILTDKQIDKVLDGIGENIIGDKQFGLVIERLASKELGYPGLNQRNLLRVRNQIFNEANAPTSYPFLWDIAHSDYVQWNGVANNAGIGPLGRNAGEVIGVFGILDWTSHKKSKFSLSAKLTGQQKLDEQIDFKSSINVSNLRRLESKLKSLQSPKWPEKILGSIDQEKAERGQLTYSKYCQGCHQVVVPDNWDRLVVAKMVDINKIATDAATAENGVAYQGKSGHLKHTVQSTGVGKLIIEENAPVLQILTSATKGVIATPDADKIFIHRWADRIYDLAASFFDNTIPSTMKSGDYIADTTSKPYNSLLAYKARSLNGIWATAPYLHNGSVPTLYDLLLPQAERPESFVVGSREFDPVKVGFRSQGYDGFVFSTQRKGNQNTGHEYAAGRTPQLDGTVLPALSEDERWDLIEYIKTL